MGQCRLFLVRHVIQDLFDDLWVFDTSDDLDRTAAAFTGLDIDAEHTFEALRPGHGGMPRGIRLRVIPAVAPGRGHPGPQSAVGGEHTVIAGEVHPRLGHQSGQPGNKVQGAQM